MKADIQTAIHAAQEYVHGLSVGTRPAPQVPESTRKQTIRYAPSFIAGKSPKSRQAIFAKPYTTANIAHSAGIKAQVILIALQLLELLERGIIDETDFAGLNLSTHDLTERLRWVIKHRGHASHKTLRLRLIPPRREPRTPAYRRFTNQLPLHKRTQQNEWHK